MHAIGLYRYYSNDFRTEALDSKYATSRPVITTRSKTTTMASNASIDESVSDDDDDIEHQVDFIHKQLTQNMDEKKRFVIVTAGKAGVGKSTLINNFLQLEGEAAFEARSGPSSVTTSVDHRDKEINGIQIRVIDMPGLHAADSGDRTDTSEDILGDLNGVTTYNTENGVDVVFYCINLLNRLENVDYENIDTLTKVFGSRIWEHVIFMFTHTDLALLNEIRLEELVERYTEALRNHLVEKRGVNVEIRSIYSFPTEQFSKDAEIDKFNGIVGIPVSKNPGIPENWRITLLLQVIRKCRKENIPALLKLKRIDWVEIKKSIATVAKGGGRGAAVGTAVGAVIGAIVGGALTAPAGGVGAIPTASGGAAIGSCIGTVVGSGSVGLTTLVTRIVHIIRSRHTVKKRTCHKIKEMLDKDKKIAQKTRVANHDQA